MAQMKVRLSTFSILQQLGLQRLFCQLNTTASLEGWIYFTQREEVPG
jgi:hypothetical protein